jgi:hypothetical protein
MRFQASLRQHVNAARRHLGVRLLVLLLIASAAVIAEDSKLSNSQRQEIIRSFLAERPFVHRAFPRGKQGIRIEGNKITPSEAELNQLVASSGPAAKPGERAQITAVHFVHRGIIFEVNGGPVKRKKWTERVSVGVNGVDPKAQSGQTDESVYTNSNGSFVFLAVKEDPSSLTVANIKDQLAPVLDFKALSVAEAYQKSLPPLLAEAVKKHHCLVGMDKEMVTYAMGRPPRRIRESKDGEDYEEWIFGAPPQEVQFIRFLKDKVVSIEEMKVTGEKVVRTQDEIGDLNGALNASAQPHTPPDAMAAPADDERRSAPSLMRPGEKSTDPKDSGRDPNPMRPPDTTPPVAPVPGPN